MKPGESLRDLRLKAGVTQRQLADAAGVREQQVYRWEQGKAKPRWSSMLKIAPILNLTIAELMAVFSDSEAA